jgi:hypothetical protein
LQQGYGILGATRNSANAIEYIGCGITAFPAATYVGAPKTSATCLAQDANGVSVSCTTTDANLMNVIQGLKGDSYLAFVYNAPTGLCTQITIYNDSWNPPKNP